MMTNDSHKNINKEIKCTDKIRYAVLMKLRVVLLKCVRAKKVKIVKRKIKNKKMVILIKL